MIGISALGLALLVALIANVHRTKDSNKLAPPQNLAEQQLRLQAPPTKSTTTLEESRSKFPDTGSVQQSEHDKRSYKYITLPNSLRVTLVSDNETQKAAASMDVFVGCMSDPSGFPGLAHLLEHMLFMGSKQFPKENALGDMLALHGGSSNAFTALQETVYYFNVDPNSLQDVLEVWSQLFVAPLLSKDAVQREVHAVDAENAKNIDNDQWRIAQLLKTTSSLGHPYHKFCTGNIDTLWNGPQALGGDLHSELLLFYNAHYSSNLMRLAVIGREPLDALEAMVRKNFADIPNMESSRLSYDAAPVREPDQLGLMYKVIPRQQLQLLSIYWILPSMTQSYRTKPIRYVAQLLGHEGEGSLLAELKRRGWGHEISVDESDKGADFTWFQMQIKLSKTGVRQPEQILNLVYEYLARISREGPTEWRWNEIRDMSKAQFRFLPKERPDDYVTGLVQSMQLFPPSEIIAGPLLLQEWDDAVVASLISKLAPSRMVAVLTSPDLKFPATPAKGSNATVLDAADAARGTARGKSAQSSLLPPELLRTILPAPASPNSPRIEHWYRTSYMEAPLGPDLMMQLLRPSTLGANSSLRLPMPNPYIPTDFSIIEGPQVPGNSSASAGAPKASKADKKANAERPELVVDENCFRAWLRTDTHFQEPRITIFIRIEVAPAKLTAMDRMMRLLVSELLEDQLREDMYSAILAGLVFNVLATSTTFEISMRAFSHKMAPMMEDLVHRIVHFQVKPERMEYVLESMQLELQDFDTMEPYKQVLELEMLATQHESFMPVELLEASKENITADDVQARISRLFVKGNVEMLMHGNLDRGTAQKITAIVSGAFQPPGETSECPRDPRRIGKVPSKAEDAAEATHTLQIATPNHEAKSSAVMNIYQVGTRTIEEDVKCELLGTLLHEPAFNQLRTKEQLGYIVSTKLTRKLGTQFFSVIVQSPAKAADYLDQRVEAFLTSFDDLLAKLPPSKLQSHIAALATDKLAPYSTALQEAESMWVEIVDRQYRFGRRFLEVEALRQVSIAEVRSVFSAAISSDSRRKLSVQIFGPKQGGAELHKGLASDPSAIADEAHRYHKKLDLYPVQPQRNPRLKIRTVASQAHSRE